MSFILDALKKSELERQRQNSPGLVEPSMVRARQRLPVWAIGLGALLAVNLLVLVAFMARGTFKSSTPPAVIGPIAVDSTPTPVPFSPLDVTTGSRGGTPFRGGAPAPVYAPEIAVPAGTAQPAPARLPADNSAMRTPRHHDPVLTDGDYKPADEESLPTINELNLTGALALPELHLDVHVFATRPAERFVYINMRKYHEGAELQEGPSVERIRRDGVILDYQNLRFLLPRQ